MLTILSCLVVMMSSAFALFHVDISTKNSTLSGAYYSVSVDKAENGTYICPLAYEDKHTFTLTALGTATSGYCRIQVGDKIYYTKPIPQGESLVLTIQAAKDTEITFTPHWGKTTDEPFTGEIVHSATPYVLYKVEPAAKLANIAAYYNVSEQDILTYNNITEIATGDEIRIPGVGDGVVAYAVPYATYVVEHTATIEDIAQHYNVSPEDILAFNGIEDITVETELKIPNVAADVEAYSVPYATYIVDEGVTIEELALYYEIPEDIILAFNGIEELTAGEELKIPGVPADIVSYVNPVEDDISGSQEDEDAQEDKESDVSNENDDSQNNGDPDESDQQEDDPSDEKSTEQDTPSADDSDEEDSDPVKDSDESDQQEDDPSDEKSTEPDTPSADDSDEEDSDPAKDSGESDEGAMPDSDMEN